MFLIFGPNDTYFFDDRKGNRKWRAWPAFDKYMASRTVGDITNIAFGEDEAFFINHLEGAAQHRNYMEDPKDRYLAFKSWVFYENVPHDRSTVAVCFGVNGGFFAKSSQGHRWRRMPEGAIDYYQKFTRLDLFTKSRVDSIDIGYNDTYLGIGVDNAWFWHLGEEYKELSRLIKQKGVDSCVWITINPFKPQQHFTAFKDGSIHWALPAHWIQDMQIILKKYAAQHGAAVPTSPPHTYAPSHDPFAHFAAQVNSALPQYSQSAPAPPPRPQYGMGSGSNPWKPSWAGNPSSQQYTPQYTPAQSYSPQYVQSPGGSAAIDWTQYMQNTQDILNLYNNALGSQTQAYQSYTPSADTVSSGFDTLNNGIQLVNNLTDSGSMIGQFVVQGVGAAAACCIM